MIYVPYIIDSAIIHALERGSSCKAKDIIKSINPNNIIINIELLSDVPLRYTEV